MVMLPSYSTFASVTVAGGSWPSSWFAVIGGTPPAGLRAARGCRSVGRPRRRGVRLEAHGEREQRGAVEPAGAARATPDRAARRSRCLRAAPCRSPAPPLEQARRVALAGAHRALGGVERAREHERLAARLGVEAAVAARHREPVRLAHGRPPTISTSKRRSRTRRRITASCCQSFSPNTATCGLAAHSSLVTTVATPRKWPGRERPQSGLLSSVTSTQVCAPWRVHLGGLGREHDVDAAPPAQRRGPRRACAGRRPGPRASLNWVGFTKIETRRDRRGGGPRRPARGAPRAAPPSSAPARGAARRALGVGEFLKLATVVSTRSRSPSGRSARRRGTSPSRPPRRSAAPPARLSARGSRTA